MRPLPKISIVIPSYNKKDFIGQTLQSIVNQKYPNLEVIIQDGDSTDGTVEIIREFAKKYPKVISWVSKKDKGQVDAINRGMKKATGDILAYINADDIYEKDAFKKVAETYLENPGASWFAGRGKVINGDGREIAKLITFYKNVFLFLNRYSLILILNYFMQPSVFITRKGYKKPGNFTAVDGIVMEYETWLKLGKDEMPVIINKVLSGFRMSGKNISATSFKKTLNKDQEIAGRYTRNPLILFFHSLNNLGRIILVNL